MSARLLALDLGGNGLRATVVDERGTRLGRAVVPAQHTGDAPPLGRCYSPTALMEGLGTATRAAVEQAGGEITAVAATGQRIGCALLDAAGETLYVGPNVDARGFAGPWPLDASDEAQLFDRTGRGAARLFAPARLAWFRDHRPELFGRVHHVVGLGEWLAHGLCREVGIDACGAVELLAIDVSTGDWATGLWSRLDLDPAWLPPLLLPGARLGVVTPAAAEATGIPAGVPVAISPPDSMAALLGAGAAAVGSSLVLAGTTMPVLACAASATVDPSRRTWTGRHPVAGRGVNESNAGSTGFSWTWLAERLAGDGAEAGDDAVHEHAEALAMRADAGAGGLRMLPGGVQVMDARRLFNMLGSSSIAAFPAPYLEPLLGPAELARATFEAIAFAARANLEQAEAARGGDPGAVILAGGMARSPLFQALLGAVTGRDLQVPADLDATTTGAAACAAAAAGIYAGVEEAADQMTRLQPAAPADAAGATHAAYDSAFHEWRALYEKISAL